MERFRLTFTANGKRQTRDSSAQFLQLGDEQVKGEKKKTILMDETDMKILIFFVDKVNSKWLVNGNLVTWYN